LEPSRRSSRESCAGDVMFSDEVRSACREEDGDEDEEAERRTRRRRELWQRRRGGVAERRWRRRVEATIPVGTTWCGAMCI